MPGSQTRFWVFMLLLVLLHLTLRVALGLDAAPNLLLVALLLGARRLNGAAAAAYGLALGLLADSLAMIAFGATPVAYVIVAFLGSRSRDLFEGESLLFTIFYVLIGAWAVDAVRFLVGGALARGDELITLVTEAPLAALYTVVAAVFAVLGYRAVTGSR